MDMDTPSAAGRLAILQSMILDRCIGENAQPYISFGHIYRTCTVGNSGSRAQNIV